jgi:hypothetical protein
MLEDTTYDGRIDHDSGLLESGLGKLTDYEYGNTRWNRRDTPWIGWNKRQLKNGLRLILEFNGTRNVSQISLHCLVNKLDGIDIFASAKIELSQDGKRYGPEETVYKHRGGVDNSALPMVLVPGIHAVCRYMRITLEFASASDWILISEMQVFSSEFSCKSD